MRALSLLAMVASPALAQDAVTLTLKLDPAAEAALQAQGEWVTVRAWYYGDPASPDVPVEEPGMVFLGTEELEVFPRSQTVTLGGGLGAAPLDWVVEPYLNVNVFTSRRVDGDNLLDCGIVDTTLAEVVAASEGAGNVISCTLLPPR